MTSPSIPYFDEFAHLPMLDSLFQHLNQPGHPGLIVGVYKHGRNVFLRGYGLADLEQQIPITPQTVFHVASVSKQFTAFAIALLARDGKLDLNADIRLYLPFVPQFNYPIAVTHLIHNTSGLRDQWELFQLGGHSLDDRLRQQQIVNLVAKQRALNFEPGTDYLYSNTNFTLLAEIVQATSGRTLREFTTERMFRPLDMSRTFFYDDVTEIVPGRAHSYTAEERETGPLWRRALLNYDNVGATSLFTTAEDLLKWAGNFQNPIVGDSALIGQVCTMGELRDGTPINYGFGLARKTYAGHRAIEHSGGDAGFRSLFIYFPAEEFGVALLANFPAENITGLAHGIADVCLNGASAPLRDHVPAAMVPCEDVLQEVAGAYLDDFAPLVMIRRHHEGLTWQVGSGAPKTLVFRADGTFDLGSGTRGYQCYRLKRDERGSVTGFEDATPSLGAYGLARTSYRRIVPASPTPAELAELAGNYRSPELDITYVFTVENGRLTARSLWTNQAIVFTPSLQDRFDSDRSSMSIIEFVRDNRGTPTGLLVSGGRIRRALLERVP